MAPQPREKWHTMLDHTTQVAATTSGFNPIWLRMCLGTAHTHGDEVVLPPSFPTATLSKFGSTRILKTRPNPTGMQATQNMPTETISSAGLGMASQHSSWRTERLAPPPTFAGTCQTPPRHPLRQIGKQKPTIIYPKRHQRARTGYQL